MMTTDGKQTMETNDKLLALHDISAKVRNAMIADASIATHFHDSTYVKLATERCLAGLKQLARPMMAMNNGKSLAGVFLFHEDRRFTTTEIWLRDNDTIVEFCRTTQFLRELKPEDVIKEIGLHRYVNGLGNAFDLIELKSNALITDNVAGKALVDDALQLGVHRA